MLQHLSIYLMQEMLSCLMLFFLCVDIVQKCFFIRSQSMYHVWFFRKNSTYRNSMLNQITSIQLITLSLCHIINGRFQNPLPKTVFVHLKMLSHHSIHNFCTCIGNCYCYGNRVKISSIYFSSVIFCSSMVTNIAFYKEKVNSKAQK